MPDRSYYTAPEGNKYDEYDSVSDSINAATTTTLTLGSINYGYSIAFCNDSNINLTAKLNSTANDTITIAASECVSLSNQQFTTVYIINALTTTISYRVIMQGRA